MHKLRMWKLCLENGSEPIRKRMKNMHKSILWADVLSKILYPINYFKGDIGQSILYKITFMLYEHVKVTHATSPGSIIFKSKTTLFKLCTGHDFHSWWSAEFFSTVAPSYEIQIQLIYYVNRYTWLHLAYLQVLPRKLIDTYIILAFSLKLCVIGVTIANTYVCCLTTCWQTRTILRKHLTRSNFLFIFLSLRVVLY